MAKNDFATFRTDEAGMEALGKTNPNRKYKDTMFRTIFKEPRHGVKLSDAFPEGASFDVEVTVHFIDIRYGRHHKILDEVPKLKGYSYFVNQVDVGIEDHGAKLSDKASLAQAIDFALKATIISDMNYFSSRTKHSAAGAGRTYKFSQKQHTPRRRRL